MPTYVLGTFYIRFFCYQGYERRKNCKPSYRWEFFAHEQLKILLWRDGVFVAESVRFVIVRYHQLPKRARGSVFAVRCTRTHARQDCLIDVDGSHLGVVRFVRNVLIHTQANTSAHGSERAQACLSEPLPRANPTQKQPDNQL